jgi:hypothetical protein
MPTAITLGEKIEHNGIPGDTRSYHVHRMCKVSTKSMHKPRRNRRYKFVSTDRQIESSQYTPINFVAEGIKNYVFVISICLVMKLASQCNCFDNLHFKRGRGRRTTEITNDQYTGIGMCEFSRLLKPWQQHIPSRIWYVNDFSEDFSSLKVLLTYNAN